MKKYMLEYCQHFFSDKLWTFPTVIVVSALVWNKVGYIVIQMSIRLHFFDWGEWRLPKACRLQRSILITDMISESKVEVAYTKVCLMACYANSFMTESVHIWRKDCLWRIGNKGGFRSPHWLKDFLWCVDYNKGFRSLLWHWRQRSM